MQPPSFPGLISQKTSCFDGNKMAFQVRVRINRNTIEVLSVASSSEEFERFTIKQLKEQALSLFPGVKAPEDLRVIFGPNELEDDQTFKSCNIIHLSVLVVVLRMPGGAPDPGGTQAQRRVNEAAGFTGALFNILGFSRTVKNSDPSMTGISSQRRVAEVQAHNYRSLSGATASLSITDPLDEWGRKPSSPGDMRDRTEGTAHQIPAGASAGPSDPDLQFVLNLLPALKRMDLRRREHTKLRLQQLVYEAEFDDSGAAEGRIRRSNSSERFRPDM